MTTTRAPKAFSKSIFSRLILSGIVNTARYPLIAATIASPSPVFPLVGSMIVPPGFSVPFASASSIIFSPIRSLTLPPGFIISSLARTRPFTPSMIFGNWTSGVFPIVSRMLE